MKDTTWQLSCPQVNVNADADANAVVDANANDTKLHLFNLKGGLKNQCQ